MRRVVLSVAAAVVVSIVGAAVWFGIAGRPVELSPEMLNVEGADIGGPFTLVDQTGRTVTSAEVIDRPTLVYFGYTWCPDVCPIDTQKMADTVDILGERGIALKPVFITVDPERDTPENLADWTEAVHPGMVALTGTPEQIKAAADAYKVYYQKVDAADSAGGYSMNHTSFFYLMTPADGLTAMFRDSATPEAMANDIERVLDAL